jgi:NTP pyrophosphatase (non-canonical NTP hydrolase)
MIDYGICPICGKPMTFECGSDVDLHSTFDGEDCHAECGLTCQRTDAVRAIVETSQMLDASYEGKGLCREAIDRRRIDKLAEEVGEVVEAYGGYVGENPRKGVTHSLSDVLAELLDVAACALGAYEHLTDHKGSSLDMLERMIPVKRDRLWRAINEPHTHEVRF